MRIYDLLTNHLTNQLGFTLDIPRLSYKVDETGAKAQEAAQIRIAADGDMQTILFDSGKAAIDSLCYRPELALAPRTRYWWNVTVWADNGDTATSDTAWFETGKMDEPWQAQWITSNVDGNMDMHRSFTLDALPKTARVYMVGLGLYELYVNGQKAGDELLAPFCNAYDKWIQVQTYDIGSLLKLGDNEITVMLGDGWYKGRFGFRGDTSLYGDTQALLLEAHLDMEDGEPLVIVSDEAWTATQSQVRASNIYDGETLDATFVPAAPVGAKQYHGLDDATLKDRLSPPVRVTERLAPKEIITTPAGETVLDLGQEITGYLEFNTSAPAGTKLSMYYFEILQNGNYYRDNLRTALEEYHYVADGQSAVVRPYFTFYGFRYVKLEGFDNPQLADFTGCVVHSDIPKRYTFTSSNAKVNRLSENVLWGQRGNFLDVPTDCPQRDERMGWTGDAQAFSGTACYQMDCAAFFDKYLYDMKMEQDKRQGSVPHVVPDMKLPGDGSCAWADAATVIPWNVYMFYGEKPELAKHYANMRDWVEWIYRVDESTGGRRVWDVGFHFADWLALDTKDGSPMGGTDPKFIATAYYYYSTSLLLKAARALDYTDDIARYEKLQQEIFDAIQYTYFTPAGRLAQTTQTGYICALFMQFAPKEHIATLAKLLARDFEETHGKLRTGFVGTAYLCRTLSQVGLGGLAYSLLLNEEYPGWLYEVNMGATTIWERWNSVLPDGMISDTGMNSLNHYAYGAVMEWVFRDVAGINPMESAPGFRRALLRPMPDVRLPQVSLQYESAVGLYISEWSIEDGAFRWHVRVPFGATAKAVFPHADAAKMAALYPDLQIQAADGEVFAALDAGDYTFTYEPVRPFETLGMDTPVAILLENNATADLLATYAPGIVREAKRDKGFASQPLSEALVSPFAEVGVRETKRLTDALAELG